MGYSANHIAIAYYDGKALITLDVKGEIVSKEICSLKTATEELEAYNLADETVFSFCRNPLGLFSKTYIAEVNYEPYKIVNPGGKKEMMRSLPLHGETQDKSLVFYDFDGKPFYSMNVTHDHAEKILDSIAGILVSGDEDEEIDLANATKNDDPDLVRSGSYMRIPGKLQIVSIGSLAGFDYDESTNCISYRIAGVKTIFSERLSPEKVKKLIEFYNSFDEFLPPEAPNREESKEESGEDAEGKKQQHESLLPDAAAAKYDPETAEAELNEVIFGQPTPIREAMDAICTFRMDLKEENKPIGSFLFLGPTGVGKTELARQISRLNKMGFVKIDMGEYGEGHDITRLKGAPPSYVGYDEPGVLEKAINENKKSVVLFDEIEKAHPRVLDFLLSALDDARITTGKGEVIDLRECIIIMTSNLTLAQAQKIGFNNASQNQTTGDPRLNENLLKIFRGETLNRIDSITEFSALTKANILRVVDKLVGETNKRLEEKGQKLSIEVDPEAKAFLADVGYNEKLGARPLKREFHKRVLVPIAREMARKDSKIASGGRAHVMRTTDGGPKGSLRIEYTAVADTDAPLSSIPPLSENSAPATKTPARTKASPA